MNQIFTRYHQIGGLHLGKFGTDILHDVNHRQEGSQGDGVVEDAGGIQRHVDAHEEWAQPLGEVPVTQLGMSFILGFFWEKYGI